MGINSTFSLTLARLEKAFKVRDIATFNLVEFQADELVVAKLEKHSSIDQFPVRDGTRTIGILERAEKGFSPDATARAHMQSLTDTFLISAEFSLEDFLPRIKEHTYYFVLDNSTIDGIVTRSDILKLPVRLLAFARITHLELVMMNIITYGSRKF